MTTLNQCKKLHILTISLEDLENLIDMCLLNRANQRTLAGPSHPAADLRTVWIWFCLSLVEKNNFRPYENPYGSANPKWRRWRPKTESSGKLLKTSPKDSSSTEYEGHPDCLWYPRADRRRPRSFKSNSTISVYCQKLQLLSSWE